MGKFHQILTGLAACFGAILMGSLNVWPSYTLSQLTNNTNILTTPMSDFESSLVGSLPSLGAMLGTAVTGNLIDYFGRKRGAMLLVLPFVLCWVIIQFSTSSIPIMVARFIGGIGGGSNLVYAPIYISEVAEPSIRGGLASGTVSLYCFGALISYLSGWFMSYTMIIWLNLSICVTGLALLTVVVESPLYLLKNNNEKEALKALAHYRTGSISSKDVLEELSLMKQQLTPAIELVAVVADTDTKEDDAEKEKLNAENEVVVEPPKVSALKSLFSTPASCRAFIVVGTALTLQVMMGMVAVQVYAGELFSKAAPDLSSDFCSVLFALVLFAGGSVTAVVADKAGRRVLVISSSAMVALSMGSLGFLLHTGAAPPWVSAVVILIYCFCFNFGAGSVPYVLLAEVFTSEVQGLASMLLVEWVWLLNFLLIAVFPFMTSVMNVYGTFYLFAAVAVCNTLISYFNIPETKGLSNKQIQEVFTK